jgi:hypothetical protein
MAARSAASARTSAACSVSFNVSERGGAFCHESRASRFVASACNQGHRNAASEFENATTRIAARSKDILRLPNSGQKLTRPATGPPAEPARQHTRLAGGTPPASLIARRFAARCIAVASYMHRRRRAASASARGPWPCSLGRSRWADRSNAFAKSSGQSAVLRHGCESDVPRSCRQRRTRAARASFCHRSSARCDLRVLRFITVRSHES